jgi:hypothetical protein
VCGQRGLVVTTVGSSGDVVELTTDDCRQPAGITDENSFSYFFNGGRSFFLKKRGFDSKNGVF